MKKEEVGRLTEQRALDTLTEKIESFEIEGKIGRASCRERV